MFGGAGINRAIPQQFPAPGGLRPSTIISHNKSHEETRLLQYHRSGGVVGAPPTATTAVSSGGSSDIVEGGVRVSQQGKLQNPGNCAELAETMTKHASVLDACIADLTRKRVEMAREAATAAARAGRATVAEDSADPPPGGIYDVIRTTKADVSLYAQDLRLLYQEERMQALVKRQKLESGAASAPSRLKRKPHPSPQQLPHFAPATATRYLPPPQPSSKVAVADDKKETSTEWWICKHCKSRAYLSRDELHQHEVDCAVLSQASGGGRGGKEGFGVGAGVEEKTEPSSPKPHPDGCEGLSGQAQQQHRQQKQQQRSTVALAVQEARLRSAAAMRDDTSTPGGSDGYQLFLDSAAARGPKNQAGSGHVPTVTGRIPDISFCPDGLRSNPSSLEMMLLAARNSRTGFGTVGGIAPSSLPSPSNQEFLIRPPGANHHHLQNPKVGGRFSSQDMCRRTSVMLNCFKERGDVSAAAMERQYSQYIRTQTDAHMRYDEISGNPVGPGAGAGAAEPLGPQPFLKPQPKGKEQQRQQLKQENGAPSTEMKEVGGDGRPLFASLPEPVMLSLPTDKDWITPLHCFVRRHCIQIFTATSDDVALPSKGKRRPIFVGQVGIRCPHCYSNEKRKPHSSKGDPELSTNDGKGGGTSRSQSISSEAGRLSSSTSAESPHVPKRGSVYYPFTVSAIYNATMNLLQRHLQACPCVSSWIVYRYQELKSDDARSGTSKKYWIDAAAAIGLVDTPRGIRVTARCPLPPLPSLTGQANTILYSVDGSKGKYVGWNGDSFGVMKEPESFARRNSNDFYSNQSNALPRQHPTGVNNEPENPATFSNTVVALSSDQQSADTGEQKSSKPDFKNFPKRKESSASSDTKTQQQAKELTDDSPKDSLKESSDKYNAVQKNPEKALEALPVGPSLVAPDDYHLATSFSYHLMAQMRLCTFTEADRLGKRKALPIGYSGLACRHCYGGYGTGRFFPSTIKTLSDTSKTLHVLYNHMLRCRKCPTNIRQSLEVLRGRYNQERSQMKFGSQKAFFAKIWSRLHGPMPKTRPSPPPELANGETASTPLTALAHLAGMQRKNPQVGMGRAMAGNIVKANVRMQGVGYALHPHQFSNQGVERPMPPPDGNGTPPDDCVAIREALQRQLEFYVPRKSGHNNRTKYIQFM